MLEPVLQRVLNVLLAADLPVEQLESWEAVELGLGPVAVLYPTPDQALCADLLQSEGGLAGHYARLAALASTWASTEPQLRLVNLALSSVPQLVGWAVAALQGGPLTDPPPACRDGYGADLFGQDLWFRPQPEALNAVIALDLLQSQPQILPTYLRLDGHSLAAGAERRPPDHDCLSRLEASAQPERLLEQCQRLARFEADLHDLGLELGAARAELIDAAWIREQLAEQLQQMEAALADLATCQSDRLHLRQQLEAEQLNQAELLANQQQIQAALEQAVQFSRSQDALHDSALKVIRGLQRQQSLIGRA
ncbi:hypothetical protein [Cyanobium sp. LEGE 06113]|uniref:hypothetical protein n=1 Tax=Cyanobium sp. LEGE 06113 TaxID=1297573 RepID=UPI0018817275|nr:hypothetical protein [Cyanobium sp. LEGE 06113]MBE9154077.1 hypothetical protein [Cyanobium sp. LEGE 06113]